MPVKFDLNLVLIWLGLHRMLCPVKDQDSAVDAQRGNNVRVLRLVSGFVNFGGVGDFLDDIESEGCLRVPVAAYFSALLVVVSRIGRLHAWDLNRSDLDVVLRLAGCV